MRVLKYFLFLSKLGPRKMCPHVYLYSERRIYGYKFSRLLFLEQMGRAEMYEHMCACLCTYMSMYICTSNHIFILPLILPPSSPFGRYLKYGTCAWWADSMYYFIMINNCVCVSLNKPTSN